MFKVLLSCSLVCSTLSLPSYLKETPSSPGIDYDKPQAYKEPVYGKEPGMPYDYAWAVNEPEAGLNYGQNEKSDGSVVTGEYRVLLPDGRTQIVRYTADHVNGYVAEVTYEGEAKPYVAPPKPAYPAPKPAYPAPTPNYNPAPTPAIPAPTPAYYYY